MHTGDLLYPLPVQLALFRARRRGQPHRQTSRRDDQRGGGMTFTTRHQIQRYGEAGPPCIAAGTPRRHEAPGHLMGITSAHRTASTRAPRRPARQTAVSQCTAPPPGTQLRPDTQHLVAISLPKSHGQPPRTPHPVSPWERRLDHGRSSARAAKTFTPGTGRPSENSGPSALRFPPNAAAFPQAPSAPQGAPRGGGPQHEKADSHGKEHRQKNRTRPSARA